MGEGGAEHVLLQRKPVMVFCSWITSQKYICGCDCGGKETRTDEQAAWTETVVRVVGWLRAHANRSATLGGNSDEQQLKR